MNKRFVSLFVLVCFLAMTIGVPAAFAEAAPEPAPHGKVVVLATGGTIEAAIKMIEDLGGKVVKAVFLMELAGLNGREKLAGYDVESVICYEGK